MLNKTNWKEFIVGDIFECSTTKAVDFDEIIPGNVNYVTRSGLNNGSSGYLQDIPSKKEKGNCITIGAEGKVAFYQDKPFLPGVKVYTLRNNHLNQNIGLFVCTILNMNLYKYSYGRARILEKIKKEIISLPQDKNGNPDWKLMNDYIDELQKTKKGCGRSISKSLETNNKLSRTINTNGWKTFKLADIFEIKYGINMELLNCDEVDGEINFVARTGENNGVSSKVKPVEGKVPQESGLVTVAAGGSVLSSFLQEEPFYSGRDLYTLRAKDQIDKYAKLFILTLIKKEKYKYSYGRQANKTLPSIEIKLPVKSDGKPDYDYMSRYMKTLPFADRI